MEEQAERQDAGSEHVARAQQKLSVLRAQHEDLTAALTELVADLLAGRKRLKIYRQFKMYNDPALNPYLYSGRLAPSGLAYISRGNRAAQSLLANSTL